MLCFVMVLVMAQRDTNVWPDFKKGKTGDFRHGEDTYFRVKVVEVIDDDTAICKLGSKPVFLVEKYAHGKADGDVIELKGEWECTGTKKVSGRTMWAVRPLKK